MKEVLNEHLNFTFSKNFSTFLKKIRNLNFFFHSVFLEWARGPSAAAITCFKENIVNYLRKLLLGKMYIWEFASFPSWGSCHLVNCYLRKCTFGKLLLFLHAGKLPLGKLSLGKMYIWEVAAREIAHLGSCH